MALIGPCSVCGLTRVLLGPDEVHRWGCACSAPYCPAARLTRMTPWVVWGLPFALNVLRAQRHSGRPFTADNPLARHLVRDTDPCAEPGPWCEGTAYGWRPDLRTGALAYVGRPLAACRILLGGLAPPVCEVTR